MTSDTADLPAQPDQPRRDAVLGQEAEAAARLIGKEYRGAQQRGTEAGRDHPQDHDAAGNDDQEIAPGWSPECNPPSNMNETVGSNMTIRPAVIAADCRQFLP